MKRPFGAKTARIASGGEWRLRYRRTLAGLAIALAVTPAIAASPAQAKTPHVTAVALYSQREFDAVRVRVANRARSVFVCVSRACRTAYNWGGGLWTIAAGRLPFLLRAGERRRVVVYAWNRTGIEQWRPMRRAIR
jgi:hypothetical protein